MPFTSENRDFTLIPSVQLGSEEYCIKKVKFQKSNDV